MTKSNMPTTLKTTLDEYAKDLKALTAIKPTMFDVNQVATMISSIPTRKWNAAQAYVEATLDKKVCEQNLKAVRAVKMLLANKMKEQNKLSNAEDRKAFVDNDEEVQAAEIAVINAEANQLAAKLGHECLDDLFTAGKRIMQYLMEQERSTQEYARFDNEARKNR